MPHSYRCLLGGLLLATLLPLAARAQTNFQPGYVVRPAGDTLRGEIDARDAYFNATQCRFRSSAGPEATAYRPAELRAYGVEGRTYRPLTPPGSAEPVFAEVLASGPATLYQVRTTDRNDRFYLEAPQFALTELAYKRLLLPGRNDYRDEPVYRLTLAQALPNCPAAERQLKSLALSGPTLTRVVQAFNQCRGVTAAPALVGHPGSRACPRLGVLLGGHTVSMRLTFPSGFNVPITPTVPNVTVPVLGPTLSVPLGGLSRKLSLELALLYAFPQRYSLDIGAALGVRAASLDYRLSYLRLPVILRYSLLPQARVRPVLEAGATLAYATTLDASTTVDYGLSQATRPFFENAQERLQQGLTAGVGLQTTYWQERRATLLFRFEANTGWVRGNGLGSDSNRVYLLLGLDLTK